jgi:hypothetical protein
VSSAQEHPFKSILSPSSDNAGREQSEDTLHDLALDEVFARIDEDAPRASSAFRTLLPTVDAIEYRQAVFRCLEQPPLRSAVETFLAAMADCDRCDNAAVKTYYPYQAELWHLRAVVGYAAAVDDFHIALTAALNGGDESSEAWTGLESHLGDYRSSHSFTDMSSDARGVQQRIAELRYNALLRGPKVTIAATDDEVDLGEQVRSTFERFRQGEVTDHRTQFRAPDLDHVRRHPRCGHPTDPHNDQSRHRFAGRDLLVVGNRRR